jgi:hypothetical protein
LRKLHDHRINIGLRELALFLRARFALVSFDRQAPIRARRRARRAPVIGKRELTHTAVS